MLSVILASWYYYCFKSAGASQSVRIVGSLLSVAVYLTVLPIILDVLAWGVAPHSHFFSFYVQFACAVGIAIGLAVIASPVAADAIVRFRYARASLWLLILTCLIGLCTMAMEAMGARGENYFISWFYFSQAKGIYSFQVWRWFTHQFIHNTPWDLAIVMAAIYLCGPHLENWLSSRQFALFYLLCGAGAVVVNPLLYISSDDSALVGAVGSVSGVLIGSIVISSKHQTDESLFPLRLVTLRTLAFILILAVIWHSLVSFRTGPTVAIGGAVVGWFLAKKPHWLQGGVLVTTAGGTDKSSCQ